MFGGVLRASGIGDALAHSLSDTGLPLIVAAYLVSAILRVAQGSATVALVTAAGLMAPAVAGAGYNPVQLACIVLATAAGSVFAGHVNDSGFWLVGRLMGMDVTTTLKVWTVQQAIESVVGFGMVCAVFGVASPFEGPGARRSAALAGWPPAQWVASHSSPMACWEFRTPVISGAACSSIWRPTNGTFTVSSPS